MNKPKQMKPPKARGLLSALGGLAGGYFGGPVGSVLGHKAGDLLSKITGMGAYSVDKNSLVGGNTVPTFRLSTEGVEIAHREFIQDIAGTTAFSLASLPINPGLFSTFPWLSSVAENFEEYEMLGLVFEYRPSSGSAVSNTSAALGVVIYATDYNVLSPTFVNKQQMESYEFSCSTVPFEGMLHPVECAPKSNVLKTQYVRNGSVPNGADQRLYDMGLFEFATQGMQSAYTVGELWVSYHIKLKKPRIPPNELGQWTHIQSKAAGTATAAAPLGTTGGALTSSSSLVGISATTNQIIVGSPGTYMISFKFSGTGITASPIVTPGSNITSPYNVFINNTVSSFNVINSGGTFASADFVIVVSASGVTAANMLTISGLTGYASGNTDVFIMPLPSVVN